MLAIETDYLCDTKCIQKIEQAIKNIAAGGFSHIHWIYEWDGDYTYSIYEMQQIKEWMKIYGLGIKALHATEGSHRLNTKTRFHYRYDEQNLRDYTSENEYNRKAGVELIKNRIEMANFLGAHEIVLHLQLPYKTFEQDASFRDRYYEMVFRSLNELKTYSLEKNVKICIENLLGTPNIHQIYQFDLLFSEFSKDFLGICFDSGHANITYDKKEGSCLELANRYSERIFAVHLCDNHGISGDDAWEDCQIMSLCDEHLLPFEGTFDWEGFVPILVGSPYELPYVLETVCTETDEITYLKRAVQVGNRLTTMVEQYKTN